MTIQRGRPKAIMPTPTPLLACAPNFRDLGGYAGLDGRKVRTGRIYRSQLIAKPTPQDTAALRNIAIRYVCDLRSAPERAMAPNGWMVPPEPTIRNLDIGMDVRSGPGELLAIISADPTVNGIRTMMMRTYSLLPGAFEEKLGPILDELVSGDHFPAVIHCTAGKDRTGFLSAILLLTLGVPLETVHHDYALTESYSNMEQMMATSARYLKSVVGDKVQPDEAMLRLLCGTSPEFLDTALNTVRAQYGSIDGYLEKTAGFDASKRARLMELMLE
jgi:protein-tyrosine phosphatase